MASHPRVNCSLWGFRWKKLITRPRSRSSGRELVVLIKVLQHSVRNMIPIKPRLYYHCCVIPYILVLYIYCTRVPKQAQGLSTPLQGYFLGAKFPSQAIFRRLNKNNISMGAPRRWNNNPKGCMWDQNWLLELPRVPTPRNNKIVLKSNTQHIRPEKNYSRRGHQLSAKTLLTRGFSVPARQ